MFTPGASAEGVDNLFGWGEARLEKGIVLYDKIRHIAQQTRVGWHLRSKSILSGRIPKTPRHEFKRPKRMALKEKSQEKIGQIIPEEWPEKASVPKGNL